MPGVAKTVPVSEIQRHKKEIAACLRDPATLTAFCDGSCLRNVPGGGPSGAAAVLVLQSLPSFQPELANSERADVKNSSGKAAGPGKAGSGKPVADEEMERIEKVHVFDERATNNQAELKGLELALDLLESRVAVELAEGRLRSKWVVFSDSQYVRGLFELGHRAHKNTEIVEGLRKRVEDLSDRWGVTIQVRWVPSHSVFYFNNVADKLAAKAANRAQQLHGEKVLASVVKKPGTGKSASSAKKPSKSGSNQKRPLQLTPRRKHAPALSPCSKTAPARQPPRQAPPAVVGSVRVTVSNEHASAPASAITCTGTGTNDTLPDQSQSVAPNAVPSKPTISTTGPQSAGQAPWRRIVVPKSVPATCQPSQTSQTASKVTGKRPRSPSKTADSERPTKMMRPSPVSANTPAAVEATSA